MNLFFAAGFYTETIILSTSTYALPTRIECRAYVSEIPEVPCCNGSNFKSLCQPDTGISRVIVDIVNRSEWCRDKVDLNSISDLALNDWCPADGQPKYCRVKAAIGNMNSGITTLSIPSVVLDSQTSTSLASSPNLGTLVPGQIILTAYQYCTLIRLLKTFRR